MLWMQISQARIGTEQDFDVGKILVPIAHGAGRQAS